MPHPINIVLNSWNEDTTNSYQFVVFKGGRFYYVYRAGSDSASVTSFYGKIKETGDTIYLDYQDNINLNGATKYLIKEISGHYLIQNFLNGQPRVFLRIQPFRPGL